MDLLKRIVLFFIIFALILVGCGSKQTSHLNFTPTPNLPSGNFNCPIIFELSSGTNTVFLGFTLSPDHQVSDWSVFDFGTRTFSMGIAGKTNWTGNKLDFDLKTYTGGLNISYSFKGTIEPANKFSGDYQIDYGAQYGSVTGKFDCDLVPIPTSTPDTGTVEPNQTQTP
jgi:hypothetical protein